jgi:hypothetical protein
MKPTHSIWRMPSLRDIWNNLRFESFPLLWPLVVRGCGILGLTNSDIGIRILGLGIGLFFLALLWLCQRRIGGRTPILSIGEFASRHVGLCYRAQLRPHPL